MRPRISFGMTLYNNARYLPKAMDSLLAQSYDDFQIIAIDDCSTDETPDIMRKYLRQDCRISYQRNESRQGMIATWRKAFVEAKRKPIDYFAWASDHDVWHPNWLETLAEELSRHEDVVLAYPLTARMSEDDEILKRPSQVFDTFNLSSRARVGAIASLESGAGNMVYGLFRAKALERAGVFRPFLLPDMLLMLELSLHGSFKQVPDELWYRRDAGSFSLKHPGSSLFSEANPMPAYCYLPYWFSHSIFLLWRSAVISLDGADVGFLLGLRMAELYFVKRAYINLVSMMNRLTRVGARLLRLESGG